MHNPAQCSVGNCDVVFEAQSRIDAVAIEGADVLIGLCSPEIIERGRDLRWIQLLNAGADSCTTIPEVAARGLLVTNLQRIQGPHMADHAIAMARAAAWRHRRRTT